MVSKTTPKSTVTSGKPTETKASKQAEPEILPPSTEVKSAGGAMTMPDFMKGDAGMGTENITRDMIETPRLKLMQGTSPELEQYDDLRQGHFFHTLTQESLGSSFIGVVLYVDEQYILWQPRESGGGILARTNDGVHWSPPNTSFKVKLDKKDGGHEVEWVTKDTVKGSGLAEFGTFNPKDPKSPPAATRMLNFLVAFPERPDLLPAVLTFQRTSTKFGKQFAGRLRTTNLPSFGCKFRIYSELTTNNTGNKFNVMKAQGVGIITDQGQYEQYKAMHLSVKEAGLRLKDIDSLQTEEETERSAESGEQNSERQSY